MPPKPSVSGRASYQSRDRQHPLKLTVTAEERRTIETRAKEAGLSVASYLRAAALGRQMRASLDHAAVGELAKVNADQGRLSGLLKLWLAECGGAGVPEIEVRRVLGRVEELQNRLAEIAGRV